MPLDLAHPACIAYLIKYDLSHPTCFVVAIFNTDFSYSQAMHEESYTLRLHCFVGPPRVGCGHKIVLSKNMSYWRTFFSGSYAFQDNMCYDSICAEGGKHIYIFVCHS